MKKISKTQVNKQRVEKNRALRAYRENAEILGRFLIEIYNDYIDGFPDKIEELSEWLNNQDTYMGNTIQGKFIETSGLKDKSDEEMIKFHEIENEYDRQQIELEVE